MFFSIDNIKIFKMSISYNIDLKIIFDTYLLFICGIIESTFSPKRLLRGALTDAALIRANLSRRESLKSHLNSTERYSSSFSSSISKIIHRNQIIISNQNISSNINDVIGI